MPLLNFYATPSLAPVQYQVLCREYDVIHYYTQQGSDKVLRVDGSRGKRVAPLYLYSRHALSRPPIVAAIKQLIKTDNLVILICDLHLIVNGVKVASVTLNTGQELFDLLHNSIDNDIPATFLTDAGLVVPTENTSIGKDVATASMGNSVMNRVLTMMYRVPAVDRPEVKEAVINYLAGNAPQFGKAGQYPPIMALFADDSIMRLRFASQHAKKHDVESAVREFKVDAFDIRYLAATTSGKPKKRIPKIEDSKGFKAHKRKMESDGQRENRFQRKLK